MQLVFMGTSAFAVPSLVRLYEERFPIRGVVTQPDKPGGRGQMLLESPVKRKARDLQLSIFQPDSLKDDPARTLFQAMAPDLIVVVAYGKILPPWLLQLPRYGAINLHGSLLPKYRGAAPIHWAIANGEVETGVCTMQIDEGLDTGPVYLCEKTSIDPNETVPRLSDRLATIGADLLTRTIRGVLEGRLHAQPQQNEHATIAPMLKKHHGIIDWRESAVTIHNRVRAFNPWPGAVTRFRGTTCKILCTAVTGETLSGPGDPGHILLEKRALKVVCGQRTILEVREVQPENRKMVSGADFANGARIQSGEKFEQLADN
jgi:methionyl-tRNA formyltransferase